MKKIVLSHESIYKFHVMGSLKYKNYSRIVEYSEENNCLFDKIIGMNNDYWNE